MKLVVPRRSKQIVKRTRQASDKEPGTQQSREAELRAWGCQRPGAWTRRVFWRIIKWIVKAQESCRVLSPPCSEAIRDNMCQSLTEGQGQALARLISLPPMFGAEGIGCDLWSLSSTVSPGLGRVKGVTEQSVQTKLSQFWPEAKGKSKVHRQYPLLPPHFSFEERQGGG